MPTLKSKHSRRSLEEICDDFMGASNHNCFVKEAKKAEKTINYRLDYPAVAHAGKGPIIERQI
jgi:hypothetical protein